MRMDREEDFLKRFGEHVKRIRQEKGISRKDLMTALKTSQSYIANIELGKISPSISKAAAIAEALGVEVTELFDFNNNAAASLSA